MQEPTTQEEIDRRDNTSSKIQIVNDIMGMVGDIDDVPTKLKMLKSLLSNAITNQEVIELIQGEIDKLEQELNDGEQPEVSEEDLSDLDDNIDVNVDVTNDRDMTSREEPMMPEQPQEEISQEEVVAPVEQETLPTPSELGVGDMSEPIQ